MEKNKSHTKTTEVSNSENEFDKDTPFNPYNYILGKEIFPGRRLHALMRKCTIKHFKFGNYSYCIVLMEHQGAYLIKGVKNIPKDGMPLLSESFWISKHFIEIERVLDES